MMELLSPAGSMEALRAAVQNGADAVYLGYGTFNARMNAKNFATPEELQQAVSYCHVRGVKVHLTLNILTTDRELVQVQDVIRLAARVGVDALIVQDWGLVRLCRQLAPRIPVHGSTQMSLHSLEGVKKAAQLGCSRVVLARELPDREIAFICRNSPIEIEVFAHGALCMGYSGQCYLSAVIGRRSGNRGQCAQPCRLPYGYGRFEDKYPLSLKDNCLLAQLGQLANLGVASLKLEGRMKRPEYVAVVTGIYRKALDGRSVSRQDLKDLEAIFSREGFTDGYYTGKTGPEMFGVHGEGREDKALLAAARATYEAGETQRVAVKFYALIQAGKPAMLAAEDEEGNLCKTAGEMPVEARNHPLTAEELEERLKKTGGTPYYLAGCKSVIDPGLMLPASAINAMRREVLVQLTAQRGRTPPPKLGTVSEMVPYPGRKGIPGLTVFVSKRTQVTKKLLAMEPEVLYLPIGEILAHPEIVSLCPSGVELCAALPRIVWSGEQAALLSRIQSVRQLGVRSLLLGNLGQITLAQAAGMAYRGDFGLNVFNSRSLQYFQEEGFSSVTASFELTWPQIRDLQKPLPTEVLIYGRLPLMIMENCVMRNRSGVCTCETGVTKLVDRMGEEFPILKDGDTCRNVLLNGKKLYWLDRRSAFRDLGLWAVRLQFTTENEREVDQILQAYETGGEFPAGSCTRGLYTRGVE